MKSTFNAPLGPTLAPLANVIKNWTWEPRPGIEIPIGKTLVMPFITTPTNIFKWSYHRAGPLALISREVRADLAAGGARQDMALARMATGSALMGVSLDLALTGTLTGGGPRDPATRQTLQRLGVQSDSLRLGDKYYSVDRIDTPFQLMSIIPNTIDILTWAKDEDRDQLGAAIGLAFSKAVVSKTYMRGVARLVDAISYPERYGESMTRGFATSFIPAIERAAARTLDPTIREVYTIADAIRANTVGLSKDLPPMRDLWGRAVMREGAWLFGMDPIYAQMISPVRVSTIKDSPIDSEILRLGIRVGRITERQGFNGVPMELTPEEVDRYSVLQGQEIINPASGKNLYDTLNEMVGGAGPYGAMYNQLGDGGKEIMIKRFITASREEARYRLMQESQPLRDAVEGGLKERMATRRPGSEPTPGATDRGAALKRIAQ